MLVESFEDKRTVVDMFHTHAGQSANGDKLKGMLIIVTADEFPMDKAVFEHDPIE